MKTFVTVLFVFWFCQQNNPPLVKISFPKSGDSFIAGAPIKYAIAVSDKEDGDTKYDEINVNEILLTVNKNGGKAGDRSALHSIMSSNCMNCHAFGSKLIGPSYLDISMKKTDKQELVRHIKDGSSGVWGPTVMPSHPELQNEEIEKMVEWIMKYKDVKNEEYYLGKEGAVKLKNPSTVTFTASYLDHDKIFGESAVKITVK